MCFSKAMLVILHASSSFTFFVGSYVHQWKANHAAQSAVAQLVEVADSIPDCVTGIFHWHNPTGRIMDLGSTQPRLEMSSRIFTAGKGDRGVQVIILPPSCAECLEIWKS